MFSVSPHLLGILPLSPLAQDHSLNESIRKKSWTVWLWKTAAEEDTMESTMKTETKAGLEVTSTVKSELSSKLVFLASQKIPGKRWLETKNTHKNNCRVLWTMILFLHGGKSDYYLCMIPNTQKGWERPRECQWANGWRWAISHPHESLRASSLSPKIVIKPCNAGHKYHQTSRSFHNPTVEGTHLKKLFKARWWGWGILLFSPLQMQGSSGKWQGCAK